jgi:hypothetical protein
MSPVIRMPFHNRPRPVNLLRHHHPRQFMRHRRRPQRNYFARPSSACLRRCTPSIRRTYRHPQLLHARIAPGPQPLCPVFRCQWFPAGIHQRQFSPLLPRLRRRCQQPRFIAEPARLRHQPLPGAPLQPAQIFLHQRVGGRQLAPSASPTGSRRHTRQHYPHL